MKKFLQVLLITILALYQFKAVAEEIKSEDLPAMIGASNAGTLFYLTFIPTLEEGVVSGSGIRIYVASKYATNVKLEIPGLGLIQQKMSIANDVIEFFLKPAEAQMYYKVYEAAKPEQIWQKRAIKISSDDPIIVYGVARFQATSDGYMALPVSSLGNSYQVASSPNAFSSWGYDLSSFTSIIGVYDDTKVTFRMGGCESCTALKQDGTYLSMNETIRRTINEGDVWLIPGIGPFSELTGSTIMANKPVAVISGNQCGQIPTPVRACDHLIEQEIPISNWGETYLVTPIVGRTKSSVIKIFASQELTDIYIDGKKSYTLSRAGGIINEGFLEIRANGVGDDSLPPKPVVISANKPINVVQFNTGAQDDNTVDNDPFQMQVLPLEQFQTDVTFNTPGIRGGHGFKYNYVNLVYLANADGSIPDDLQWAEVVDGDFHWIPMSSYSGNPGQRFLTTEPDGRHYRCKTMKLPYDGVFKIKSDSPIAAYIYGSDWYDSYGFPATGRFLDMTTDEQEPPFVQWSMDEYGNVFGDIVDKEGLPGLIEKDGEMVQAVNDPSGVSVISLLNAHSSNYKFKVDGYIVGTKESVDFSLEPINKFLDAKGVIIASDRRGNDTSFVVNYIAPSVPTISGLETNFGFLQSLKEKSLDFELKNDKNQITLPIKSIFLTNNDSQFEIINNVEVNKKLEVGESFKFSVKFKANDMYSAPIDEVEQQFTNILGIEMADGAKIYFDTLIAAVANPRIEVTDVDFATKLIGENYKDEFVFIYNKSTNFDLKVSQVEISGDDVFDFQLPSISESEPLIIKPGKEFYIRTKFNPKDPGEYSAKLKFLSDGFIIKNEAIVTAKALVNSITDNNLNSEIDVKVNGSELILSSSNEFFLEKVEIFDLSGRAIYLQDVNSTTNFLTIKLPNMTPGVYMLKLKSNTTVINKHFVY